MLQQLECELAVLGCRHDAHAMFAAEYKRSNRTRMSKILRCFPHCCPVHRQRSYCGTTLHVLLRVLDEEEAMASTCDESKRDSDEQPPLWHWESEMDADGDASDRVVRHVRVYGRFEQHDPDEPSKTAFRLGERLEAAQIQQNQDPAVIWVEGLPEVREDKLAEAAARPASVEVARLFVLNEGDGESHHWEYDWRSGTSQRKRACLHQFRAYVFLPDADDATMWQVVGMAASTPFTLSSYRRQQDDDDDVEADDALLSSGSAYSTTAATSTSTRAAAMPAPARDLSAILWAHQHQPTIQATTHLTILWHFLMAIDVSWISADRVLAQVASILQARQPSPHRLDAATHRYLHACVPALLNAFSMRMPPVPPPPPALATHLRGHGTWHYKWRDLMQLCVELMGQMLTEDSLARLQANFRLAARGFMQPEVTSQAFIQCAMLFATTVVRALEHASERVSLDFLVDEIVSCIHDHDDYLTHLDVAMQGAAAGGGSIGMDDGGLLPLPLRLRDTMHRLLRNTALLGLDEYRSFLRHLYVVATEPTDWPASSAAVPAASLQDINAMRHLLNGRWECVAIDSQTEAMRLEQQATTGTRASVVAPVSVASVLQLALAAQRLDIDIAPDGTQARLRSLWSLFPELRALLLIDGRCHAADVFPHGAIPAMWQCDAQTVVGDYRCDWQRAADGTRMLQLDVFSCDLQGPCYCSQVTFVPQPRGEHARLRVMHVHVRLLVGSAAADVQARYARDITSLSPAQRCDLVAFSHVVMAAELRYEAVD